MHTHNKLMQTPTNTISSCLFSHRSCVCVGERGTGKTSAIRHLRDFFGTIMVCSPHQTTPRVFPGDPHPIPTSFEEISPRATTVIIDDAEEDVGGLVNHFVTAFLKQNIVQIILVTSGDPLAQYGFEHTVKLIPKFVPKPFANSPETRVTTTMLSSGGDNASGQMRYNPVVIFRDDAVSEEQLQMFLSQTPCIPHALFMDIGTLLVTSNRSKKVAPGKILQVIDFVKGGYNPWVRDISNGDEFELFRDIWKPLVMDVELHQFNVHVGLQLSQKDRHGLLFEFEEIIFS